MYLHYNDYQLRISLDLLNILIAQAGATDDANTILISADKIAMDTIKTKAGVLYDLTAELQKNGNERNGYLISLALSIALYEVYMRSDDEEIPPKVIKNYEDALDALDKIANGKDVLDLPPKIADNGSGTPGDGETVGTMGNGLRRLGSQKKRTHQM